MLYSVLRFIVNIYLSCAFRIDVRNRERVPDSGSIILCANHTHWGDPVILACRATKRPVHFMAKIELYKNRFITWFFNKVYVIPIKRNQSDISAIKTSLRVLKEGHVLGLFPEGTRVKKGEVKEAEPGLAMLAIKSKATIVPVGIESSYKIGSKIKVNVGNPISLDEYYGKKVSKEEMQKISNDVMKEIRRLVNE